MPFTLAKRPGQGMFGRAAGGLSDGEFLPIWKKCPGPADKLIRPPYYRQVTEFYSKKKGESF
jgi:hypothetical protein